MGYYSIEGLVKNLDFEGRIIILQFINYSEHLHSNFLFLMFNEIMYAATIYPETACTYFTYTWHSLAILINNFKFYIYFHSLFAKIFFHCSFFIGVKKETLQTYKKEFFLPYTYAFHISFKDILFFLFHLKIVTFFWLRESDVRKLISVSHLA